MLAHLTNPDLALNLPHLEEKIQREVVIMEVEQNKGNTLLPEDNSEDNGHQVKKFKVWQKIVYP